MNPYRLPPAAVERYKQMMAAQPVQMVPLPPPPPRFPTPGRMDGVRSFFPKGGSGMATMMGIPAMFGGR
jgi:hypothetical protein